MKITQYLTQRNIQVTLTILVLIALLQFSFFHVAAMFARFTEYPLSAYIAALGIEISVFVLSLAIGWKNKVGDKVGFFWTVLVMSLFISTIANVSEAWYTSEISLPNIEYTWFIIGSFVTQVSILLAANLLTPFIIMSQAEILGDFASQFIKETDKKVKTELKKAEAQQDIETFGQADTERRTEIYNVYWDAHIKGVKSPTQAWLQDKFNKSQPAIAQDIQQLVSEGKLHKNGSRSYKIKEGANNE